MSFDIGSAASSSASFGGSISTSVSAGPTWFEEEEPLLVELGVHPDQIRQKTKSILNPFRINPNFHKDSDLSGPIFLYFSFCLFQLLAGKIQFGVIVGWIVVSSIFLYVVFNMLAGRNGNLDLHTLYERDWIFNAACGGLIFTVAFFPAKGRWSLDTFLLGCLCCGQPELVRI